MAQTLAVQFGGMGVLLVLVIPEAALLAAQFVTGSALPGWINLVLGPVLGLALLAAGRPAGRQVARCPRAGTAGPAGRQPLTRALRTGLG